MHGGRSSKVSALLFGVPGLVIILMGFGLIPVDQDSLYVPRWMLVVVGLPFLTIGLWLFSQSIPALSWFADYVVLIILTSLTVLATWAAFGPGSRNFESNVPFLDGEFIGRFVFGISGLFLGVITTIGWFRVVRYWITGNKDW